MPVDHEAHAISLHDSAYGVFRLTTSAPPTTGEVANAWFANCGMPAPVTIVLSEDLDDHDQRVRSAIGVCNPYLNNPQVFDRGRTDTLVSNPGAAAGKTDDGTLRHLFQPFRVEHP